LDIEREGFMKPDMTARRKKEYHKPTLKRLDPSEAIAEIKAAAKAGNKSAQKVLERIGGAKPDRAG
jgi:hypothetical protein